MRFIPRVLLTTMQPKVTLFLRASVVFLIFGSLPAEAVNWVGWGGDWSDVHVWNTLSEPGPSDYVGMGCWGPPYVFTAQITQPGEVCGKLDVFGDNVTLNMLSGGLAAQSYETIGVSGTGIINQSGGVNNTGSLFLSRVAGSTGRYSLSGTGELSADQEFIGSSHIQGSLQGTGLFTQTGGKNTAGELWVGAYASTCGEYNLSGGELTAYRETIGSKGTFNQSGGTHTVYDRFNWGSRLEIYGQYALSGGDLFADNISVGNFDNSSLTATFVQTGGTNNVRGNLILGENPSDGYYGTKKSKGQYLQSGGINVVQKTLYVGGTPASLPGDNVSLGTYRLSDTGILVANQGIRIGADNVTGRFEWFREGGIMAPSMRVGDNGTLAIGYDTTTTSLSWITGLDKGRLEITNGAHLTQGNPSTSLKNVVVGSSNGSGTYRVENGSLNVRGELRVGADGGPGRLEILANTTHSVQKLTLGSQGTLAFGIDFLLNSLPFSGGSVYGLETGTLEVTKGATGRKQDNTTSTLGHLKLGSGLGSGTFYLEKGTLNILGNLTSGGRSSFSLDNATLTVGGSIFLDNLTLGHWTSGNLTSFTQASGTNVIGRLSVGAKDQAVAIYTLDGGSLNVPNGIQVGNRSVGGNYGAFGQFNWVSGNLTTSSLAFGENSGLSMGFDFNRGALDNGTLFHGSLSGLTALTVTHAATATHDNATTVPLTTLVIGTPGGPGTYNQSAGFNSAKTLALGIDRRSPSEITTGAYFLSGGIVSSTAQYIGGWLFGGNFWDSQSYRGDNNSGSFTQTGGENRTGSLMLGCNAADSGTYSLSGTGKLVATGAEYVGNFGTGTITQTGGSNECSSLFLGVWSDSVGNRQGDGSYVQQSGTNTVTGTVWVGAGPGDPTWYGGRGSYDLSGTGTLKAGSMTVGKGYFNQTGGLDNITDALTIGPSTDNTTGVYNLGGTGTLLAQSIACGGTFNQTAGTSLIGQKLTLSSYLDNATATYNLSGMSQLSAANEYIGADNGTSIFNHTGGTNTVVQNLFLGHGPRATGTYNLSGQAILKANTLTVGNGGTGTFNQTGGVDNISSNLILGLNSGSTGTYALLAGSLSVGGDILDGSGTGTLIVDTNDTLSVAGNITVDHFYLGDNRTTCASYTQSHGNTTINKTLWLGCSGFASGTYRLTGGSLSVMGDITGARGPTDQSSLIVDGGTLYPVKSIAVKDFILGSENATNGYYGLDSAGKVYADTETIGKRGGGTFDQSGGTNSVSGTVSIGDQAGSSGTYNLSGTGSLIANSLVVGNGGVGSLNQTGGTDNVTTDVLMGGTGGKGTYRLAGGSLYVGGNINKGSGTSALIVDNGSLTVAGNITVDEFTLGEYQPSCYTQSHGMTAVRNLRIATNFWAPAVYTATGGTLACARGGSIYIGGSGVGVFNLGNGQGTGIINETGIGLGVNLTVRNGTDGSGTLQGWGAVAFTGGLANNGRIIADGFGQDRDLDLSTFTAVINPIANSTTNGWFAQNRGRLVLPAMAIPSGFSSGNWGDDGNSLGNLDLVNSVYLAFTDINGGTICGSLLAPDRPELGCYGNRVGAWLFDPTALDFADGFADLTFRYDDARAAELGIAETDLRLYQRIGTDWVDVTGAFDSINKLIGTTNRTALGYFVVGTGIVSALPGDANADGRVNFADFAILQNHYNQNAGWSGGDFNGDHRVTFEDFSALQNYYGQSYSAPGSLASVPEPTSVLLLIGLVCCANRSLSSSIFSGFKGLQSIS